MDNPRDKNMIPIHHNNPFKLLWLAGAILMLIAVMFDPMLRGLLMSGRASAVGGYSASDVLGQLTGADAVDFDHGGVNNSPNSRGFDGPTHIATDVVRHRLFVADYNNNRILQFDLDVNNLLIDRIADHVIGQPNFRSLDPGAGDDSFSGQTDILYDGANDLLYVADGGNNRVMVFDAATITNGEPAINVLGQPDFDTTTPTTTQVGMDTPDSLALDSDGDRLFVGDYTASRVLVFDVAGIVNGEPAINVLGHTDFVTGAVPFTDPPTPDVFDFIDGVAYDSVNERLFVDDAENSRILVFDVDPAVLIANTPATDGPDAINVLGQAIFTTDTQAAGPAGMFSPAGLSLDEAGQRLFVDDYANHRITVFDVNPAVLIPNDPLTDGPDAINVLGQLDFAGTTAGLSASAMNAPYGIEYDPLSSLLYAAEDVNNRVTIFNVSTIVNGEDAVNLLGQLDENDQPVYTTNGGNNAPNAQGFNSAYGAIALDTDNHRLFVSDRGNSRILVFNLDTDNTLIDHTADFVLGQPDFKGSAGGTSVTSLNVPVGISYDGPDNLLFVADADNHRIIVYDTATIVDGEPAIHQLGQDDFNSGFSNRGGGSNAAINSFLAPESVSIEPVNGLLAVSDGNNRVLIYDFGGPGLPLLVDGMDASRVYGHADFVSESSGTTATTMADPRGVLVETLTNSLWVADTSNNRVLRFDLFDPNSVDGAPSAAALNVLGQSDFISGTAATTQSGMSGPVHLDLLESIGSDQRLFVTDGVNNRVLVFNTADGIVDGEDAVDVYGQTTFVDSGFSTTQSGFNIPRGLEYDESSGVLYVADGDNNRVMIFGPVAPVPTPNPGGGTSPQGVGFFPDRIVINDEDANTDSKNVLVDIYAHYSDTFSGTVDVLLSNTPDFSTTVPFRYAVPKQSVVRTDWLKTVAWDLCFGLQKSVCDLGRKVVYARFYVNLPSVWPALTPLGQPNPAP